MNSSAVGSYFYTSGSPTTAGRIASVGSGAQVVLDARKRSPEVVFYNDARYWVDFLGQDGSTDEPVQRPGGYLPQAALQTGQPVTNLGGLPLYVSPQVPQLSGNDMAVLTRPSDQRLWMSQPEYCFLEAGYAAQQLSVVFQWTVYVAFAGDRYGGTETAYVSGTGWVAES